MTDTYWCPPCNAYHDAGYHERHKRLWLPPGTLRRTVNTSVTIPAEQFYRTWLVGVCKCGHAWIMHFHNNNPARPGTSCDEWNCKCKRYRLRRLRRIGPRRPPR